MAMQQSTPHAASAQKERLLRVTVSLK